MSENEPGGNDGDGEEYECPACGRDDFSSERGMKNHYAQYCGEAEQDSIAGVERVCENCGEVYRKRASRDATSYCSLECKAEAQEQLTGEANPNYAGRTTKTCGVCGDQFTVVPSREDTARFCSYECKHEGHSSEQSGSGNSNWDGGKVEVICDWCEDPYYVKPATADRTSFCSQQCQGDWLSENKVGKDHPLYNRESVACDNCGEQTTVSSYRAEALDRHFCNRECFKQGQVGFYSGPDNPNWDGGIVPYGPGWTDSKRKLIRERDGRECRVCGKTEVGHVMEHGRKHTVHHVVKARDLQDVPGEIRNAPLNLVTMCTDHHLHEWEEMPPLMQFVAFLPHPPLPTDQATIEQFATSD